MIAQELDSGNYKGGANNDNYAHSIPRGYGGMVSTFRGECVCMQSWKDDANILNAEYIFRIL